MDIGNSLRRAWRDDITIRSVIANSIYEIYPHEITIKSVQIHGNKVIVKTGSSLISSELQLLSWTIKEKSLKKLYSMKIELSKNIVFYFI